MTLEQIKELIEFIKSHDLNEFELEQDGVKIRIKGGSNHHQVVAVPHLPAAMPLVAAPPVASALAASAAPAAPVAPATDDAGELCIVKSPIVGTFYRSAEPG